MNDFKKITSTVTMLNEIQYKCKITWWDTNLNNKNNKNKNNNKHIRETKVIKTITKTKRKKK